MLRFTVTALAVIGVFNPHHTTGELDSVNDTIRLVCQHGLFAILHMLYGSTTEMRMINA